jgi:hypothetical protein
MFVVWQVSRFFGILLLLVLWILVIYQIVFWLKTKNDKPNQQPTESNSKTMNKDEEEDKLAE